MLVFRESAGRATFGSGELRNGLAAAIRRRDPLDALLRAGELECSLADLGADPGIARVTDALAHALVTPAMIDAHLHSAEILMHQMDPLPQRLDLRAPEGFAYYALHPLSYAIRRTEAERPAAVVGIRSIGTTLSAVAAAALKAERITVRPTGHPYHRTTQLSPAERAWVHRQCAAGAEFFVVDEGPGLSGSSFLSVGEALVEAGVPHTNILLVCSHAFEPGQLVTDNASTRWKQFRTVVVTPTHTAPAGAVAFVDHDWRRYFLDDEGDWPAVWTHMSVPKMGAEDGCLIFKFEGFGRYGEAVRRRSSCVAGLGFGPVPTTAGNGWTAYESLPGKAPVAGDLDSELVELLAEYVSARAADFTATDGDVSKLEEMVRFNAGQLWGRNLEHGFRLPVERPVIADGRMMPYEWRRSGEKILKLDAGAHGDNHFFPGPVDIAWDLAGAIVEWDMSAQHRGAFLDRYRARSGDNAEHRMSEYIVAYCAFQAGYAQMAAAAMAGSAEAKRFQRELARYARAAVHHGPITGVRNRIPRSRPPLSPARQM